MVLEARRESGRPLYLLHKGEAVVDVAGHDWAGFSRFLAGKEREGEPAPTWYELMFLFLFIYAVVHVVGRGLWWCCRCIINWS